MAEMNRYLIYFKDETTGEIEAEQLVMPGELIFSYPDPNDSVGAKRYFVFLIEDEIVGIVNPSKMHMIKKDKNYKGE